MLFIFQSADGELDVYVRVEDKFWNQVEYHRVWNFHVIQRRRPIFTLISCCLGWLLKQTAPMLLQWIREAFTK